MVAPAPSLPTLSELVERAAHGDRQAESTLSQRFAPAVRAFARRRLRGVEATEDFAHDVLLLFVEALRRGSVQEPERLGGYVLGICRKLALDRARMNERRAELWEQFGESLAPLAPEATARDCPYELIHLEDCLSRLSQRSREVVRLGFIEAQGNDSVAQALGVTEANARILRHRALSSLRECMSRTISWEAA